MKRIVFLVVLTSFILGSLSACTKSKVKQQPLPEPVAQKDTTPPPPPPPPPPQPEPTPPPPPEPTLSEIVEPVYFDFDSYEIRPDAEVVLKRIAEYLEKHPDVKLIIEGHADERGTESYNLALGQRRADAVKNYFVSYGLSPDRFKTISYGELRPAVPGHNEEAWAKNRRCEFKEWK